MENNRSDSGTTNEVAGQVSVVFMDRFRFDSLSKHMKPFYADLIRHENANEEHKAIIRRKVCVNFYRNSKEGNIVPLFSESKAGGAGNKNFPPQK